MLPNSKALHEYYQLRYGVLKGKNMFFLTVKRSLSDPQGGDSL